MIDKDEEEERQRKIQNIYLIYINEHYVKIP